MEEKVLKFLQLITFPSILPEKMMFFSLVKNGFDGSFKDRVITITDDINMAKVFDSFSTCENIDKLVAKYQDISEIDFIDVITKKNMDTDDISDFVKHDNSIKIEHIEKLDIYVPIMGDNVNDVEMSKLDYVKFRYNVKEIDSIKSFTDAFGTTGGECDLGISSCVFK